MKYFKQIAVVVILLCSTRSFGQKFSRVRLDSLLNALQDTNQGWGSVAISHDGKMVYSRAFGDYSKEGPAMPANIKTGYRIGSVTKIFTAVMALQLVEEHKLELNTPVKKYFPGLPNGDKITVDMLIGHRSGMHDYTTDAAYVTYARQPATRAAMLARIAKFKPDFKPGEKAFYSSTNYLLLGYIIEQAGGKPYAEQLEQRITSKIGLLHTRYAAADTRPKTNEALPYNFIGNKWLAMPLTDLSIAAGAGAVISTPTDMVVFIRALFKLKLLNKTLLAAMTPLSGNIGRGLVQVPVADEMAFGHFGMIDGFKSTLLYLPQTDLAVALCFNTANTNDNAVVEQVLNITLQQLSHKINLPVAQLIKYTGTYTSRQLPVVITLRQAGGFLSMQADKREILPLETLGTSRFRFAKGDMQLDFNLLPNKQPNHFTLKQANNIYEFYKQAH